MALISNTKHTFCRYVQSIGWSMIMFYTFATELFWMRAKEHIYILKKIILLMLFYSNNCIG